MLCQFRNGAAQTAPEDLKPRPRVQNPDPNPTPDPDPNLELLPHIREFYRMTEEAFACLTRAQYPEAAALFKQALVLKPNDVQALYNVAAAETQLGNLDVAQGYLQMAAECVSDPWTVPPARGLAPAGQR